MDDEDNVLDTWALEEIEKTDNRTKEEELRCVLAVIRHGGAHGGPFLAWDLNLE